MSRKYVIHVDGQAIEVAEQVYRMYKRSLWNERSRRRYRLEHESSLDAMMDSGMEPISNDALVEDIVADRMMLEALFAALQSLPGSERDLIRALYFEAKTEREVAAGLGISSVAVHKQKHRILKKLKEIFG